MSAHSHFRWSLLSALLLTACAGSQQVIRNEMKLQGESSVTLDGLAVSAKLLDGIAIKSDSRFSRKVSVTGTGLIQSASLLGSTPFVTIIDPPAFELRVRNNTGHVVRLQGTVIKLIDGAGNLYDALDRTSARDALDDTLSTARAQGYEVSNASSQELRGALSHVKFLTENGQLLPDVAETFIVAFAISNVHTEKELNEWLALQTSLRLKVYDVPTRTNEAGTVTKRVSFEFPVEVKTFRETYQTGPDGRKLTGTEEVAK